MNDELEELSKICMALYDLKEGTDILSRKQLRKRLEKTHNSLASYYAAMLRKSRREIPSPPELPPTLPKPFERYYDYRPYIDPTPYSSPWLDSLRKGLTL